MNNTERPKTPFCRRLLWALVCLMIALGYTTTHVRGKEISVGDVGDAAKGIAWAAWMIRNEYPNLSRLTFSEDGLRVSMTYGSDKDLSLLKDYPNLQEVTIRSLETDHAAPKVRNAGLEVLTELPQLKKLELNCKFVNDDGLKHLQGCAQLESLDITLWGIMPGNGGVGKSFAPLAEMPQLKELRIRIKARDYSEKKLEVWKTIPSLKEIHFTTSDGMTAEQQKTIQDALPNCEVVWEQPLQEPDEKTKVSEEKSKEPKEKTAKARKISKPKAKPAVPVSEEVAPDEA